MNGILAKRKSVYALNVKVHILTERREMQTKKCSKCGEIKSISKFCKKRASKDGLNLYCGDCRKEYFRIYRDKNKERLKCYFGVYYKDNIKLIKEKQKEYYKDNNGRIKEQARKYYENNIEKKKAGFREYRKNNIEKDREHSRRRRASIWNTIIEKIDFPQVCEDRNWICGICGKKINKKIKHPNLQCVSLDHKIPLSKGGTHTYSNIQPTHLICNLYKYNNINNIQLELDGIKNDKVCNIW
jgi:hypothetical protein